MRMTALAVVISLLLTVTCFAAGKGHRANGTFDHIVPTNPEWVEVYSGAKGHKFYVEISTIEFSWRKRQADFYLKEVVKGNEKGAKIYDCIWSDQNEYFIMSLVYKGPQVDKKYAVKRKFKDYENWGSIHARHKACIYRIMEIVAEQPERIKMYDLDDRFDYTFIQDRHAWAVKEYGEQELWEDSQW